MFTNKIPPHTQKLLGLLNTCVPDETYLAGGTALALHLNHRASFDLDLYTQNKFNEQQLTQRFVESLPEFKLVSSEWQTIQGRSMDTDVSIFYYEYKLLTPTELFENLEIASINDIAAMKLEAISSRGLKRDFFDLYSICTMKQISLKEVFDMAIKKYDRGVEYVPHYIKSLTYFGDAETMSERAQIIDTEWHNTKQFFINQTVLVSKYFQI